MISGGNATVYVADMDAAVQFYTATLGLALTNRFGNHWATLEAGPCYWSEKGAGLTIGLHPVSPAHPAPGTSGGVGYGLATYVNEFPPDMVPLTDLGGEDHTAKASPTSSRLGGHAIVYVSNMDAGVRFYSEKLGLPLTNRYGDQFATVEAGDLVLAIHPRTPKTPDPGTRGSVTLGLQVDEPMERVVSRLTERGVRVLSESAPPDPGARVELEDEDGNPIYLWEARAAAFALRASAPMAPSRVAASR